MKQRKLEYFRGILTSKFELFNYIDFYVHCFAPIQVSCLPKRDDSVIDMLKEDSISARNKAKSFKKANVCSGGIRSEPEADLYNVDDNPNSTWHNRESKETSNRYAALKKVRAKLMILMQWNVFLKHYLLNNWPKIEEEEQLSVSTVISPQKVHKAECNAVNGSTTLVSNLLL
ncbi:hypothetical protein FRX31_028716 [Thalictrum thalictroides]|uniref:Uncharacterized protein n=1 Tax=Thalictrum thalictroides TaxID=46969 RepID=A0A7J6VA98_THATH|nr:hypothetical protein FRX31_028716 [Thalictrum thalictroides]